MSRPRRLIWLLLLVPVLLVAAGAAYVGLLLNPASLKPRIEAAVFAATGRRLDIAGPLQVGLLPSPSLLAQKVSFANRPGGSDRPMATLARLQARIALLPLLHRQVVIERLVLDHPDILLEVDPDGVGNWQMAPPQPATPDEASAAADSVQLQNATAADVQLRAMTITDATVTWRNARSGITRVVQVPSLTLSEASADAPLEVAGQFRTGTGAIGIQGSTGPLARLRGGGEGPWPVKLALTSAGATLSLDGTIADPARGSGVALALQADVPDLQALAPLLPGTSLPPLHATSLTGRVDVAGPGGPFALHGLVLHGAAGTVSGDLTQTLRPRPDTVLTLRSDRIDLDALPGFGAAKPPQHEPAPAAPPPVAQSPVASGPVAPGPATPKGAGGAMLPDTPLGLARLRDGDADLTLAVGTLIERGVSLSDLALHASLQDGVLTVDRLALHLPQGTAQGTLRANAVPAVLETAATLQVQGTQLTTLETLFGMRHLADGIADVHADLSGHGDTPQAIAASLNGRAGLAVVGGRIETEAALAGLASALPTPALANAAKGVADLRCLAVQADFKNGLGTVNTLVLDSSRLTVTGSGQVALGPETLDLHLKPRLDVGGGTFVNLPVQVSGPWRRPHTGWDGPAPNGKAGFSAVIGSLEQVGGPVDCAPALQSARLGAQGAAPPPAAKQAKPDLGGLLRQLFH